MLLQPSSYSPLTANLYLGHVVQAKRACYGKSIKDILPHMKIILLGDEASAPFSFPAFWEMQKDNEDCGGGTIDLKMIPEVNHFVRVEGPELAMKLFLEAMK